ncbi:hypothetical protein Tco_1244467 [Tanacetum coccineum]
MISMKNEGTAEVFEGTEEVHEGTEEVQESTAQVHEGTAQVNEGTAQVNEGTAEVNESTAEKIKVPLLFVKVPLVLSDILELKGKLSTKEDFVSFREMIHISLQEALLFDEVSTRLCLFCSHQMGKIVCGNF